MMLVELGVAVRVIVPVKPDWLVSVIIELLFPPCGTVTDGGLGEI